MFCGKEGFGWWIKCCEHRQPKNSNNLVVGINVKQSVLYYVKCTPCVVYLTPKPKVNCTGIVAHAVSVLQSDFFYVALFTIQDEDVICDIYVIKYANYLMYTLYVVTESFIFFS